MSGWYRNAGSEVYHLARTNWVRSGRARCGVSIRHPGYVATNLAEVEATKRSRPCKRCKNKMEKNDG